MTVMAVKTVVTLPFTVTAVDQPISRDVDNGGKLIVVWRANVFGGNTKMHGGGHVAVAVLQTAGSSVTTGPASLPGPLGPPVELPQTSGQ